MAETAFAQGDPVWDEFDAEYDTTEYHSDWSYYSDGGFFSDEEQPPGPGGKKKEQDNAVAGAGVNGQVSVNGGTGTGAKVNSGRPLRKRRKLMVADESGKRVPESAPMPAHPASAKVTATVIVPPPPTPPKKLPGYARETNGVSKNSPPKEEDKALAGVDGIRVAMKRKPSTDETEGVSP